MQARPVIAAAVPDPLRSVFLPNDVAAALGALGHVRWLDRVDDSSVRTALTDAEVVVTAWGFPRLDEDMLAAAPRLRLVAHTGASVHFLVSDALFARGVRVTQAGAAMARPVAETALAFTLALLHQVHRFDHALRGGAFWDEARTARPRHELAGTPVGVIGASRTGRAYIDMVTKLGAEVGVHDPVLSAADAARLGVTGQSLTTLLETSRIVAVHAPALPQTHHLLGADELRRMPDGAGLVNTARSWLVDQDALLAELRTGRIDAALDVYDEEPLPVDSPLRALPNVLLTPHQAGDAVEARHRAGEIVVAEIGRYLRSEPLQHEVTATKLPMLG